MNKKIFRPLAIVFLCILFITPLLVKVITAANSDVVVATVTAGLYSVEVTDGSVDFGTVSIGTTKSGYQVGVGQTQAAINLGTLTTKLNIGGTDTTSTGIGWTLAATAAADEYTMRWCLNCGGTGPWTDVGRGGAYETLVASLAVGATQAFDLQIGTPTSTAETAQQSTSLTIQAVAP